MNWLKTTFIHKDTVFGNMPIWSFSSSRSSTLASHSVDSYSNEESIVSYLLESCSFCLVAWSWRCERNFDQIENLRSASSYYPPSFLPPPSWYEVISWVFESPLPFSLIFSQPYPTSDSLDWRKPLGPAIRDQKNESFYILRQETHKSPKRLDVGASHCVLPSLLSIPRTEAPIPSSLIRAWSFSVADTRGSAFY